jgi:hypothetical protein
MARVTTLVTRFSNGVGQFLGIAPGGSAGVLTVTGGIAVGDRILNVHLLVLSGALAKTLTDLTSEFVSVAPTCLVANQIKNTGGTSTAAGIVLCQYAVNTVN